MCVFVRGLREGYLFSYVPPLLCRRLPFFEHFNLISPSLVRPSRILSNQNYTFFAFVYCSFNALIFVIFDWLFLGGLWLKEYIVHPLHRFQGLVFQAAFYHQRQPTTALYQR